MIITTGKDAGPPSNTIFGVAVISLKLKDSACYESKMISI